MTALLRLLIVFSFAALVAVPAAGAADFPGEPGAHTDRADVPESPVDIVSAQFGQQGTQLFLRIRTAGVWTVDQLDHDAGRSLCVKLYYGKLLPPRGRICVIKKGEDAALGYSRLDPFGGTVGGVRPLQGVLEGPDMSTVEGILTPVSANLNMGRYSWQVESRWTCDAGAECLDKAPDNGNVLARVQPLVTPACFGAAARNPRHRCSNPEFRRVVVPKPADAVIAPNAPCTPQDDPSLYACAFGVRRVAAKATFALIGDSHAAHWRPALEVVARAKSWSGISMSRTGCAYSAATPDIPAARRSRCATWRKAVRAWLAERKEVRTIFVSQLASTDIVLRKGGEQFEGKVRGYVRAWRRLPKSVRNIVVIRDTPVAGDNSLFCTAQAAERRRNTGVACALPRRGSLPRDPAVAAARRMRSRRVKVVDMTGYMCGPRYCYPVVGGALVHKDKTHLTEVFGSTLGPFLLRAINAVL